MQNNIFRINERLAIPFSELDFRFSRSGGPGGQKVNRTASQVELLFDVGGSSTLTDRQRNLIRKKLGNYIDKEGVLHLTSQATPSQWRNRQDVLDRLRSLLRESLRVSPRRIPTRPSRSARERRLENKRRRSLKKRYRGRVRPDEY